eukprot:scaffold1214_cov349-Prasinococcus_capsulatus_cf.AAC.3
MCPHNAESPTVVTRRVATPFSTHCRCDRAHTTSCASRSMARKSGTASSRHDVPNIHIALPVDLVSFATTTVELRANAPTLLLLLAALALAPIGTVSSIVTMLAPRTPALRTMLRLHARPADTRHERCSQQGH